MEGVLGRALSLKELSLRFQDTTYANLTPPLADNAHTVQDV
jgi:hypothetical protein